MEQGHLLANQAPYIGATVHFERHLKWWKIWNNFQYFFLILTFLLVICYFAEHHYKYTNCVPYIIGTQCIIQIIFYAYWRYLLRRKENFMQLAQYMQQQTQVNHEWIEVSDMHYYYRYELYRGNLKFQMILGYQFRFYMYKNYCYGIPMLIYFASIAGIVWFFEISELQIWQYTTTIVFLLFVTLFDIVAVSTYPLIYWSKKLINYCRKRRYQRPYKVGLLETENNTCAICLMDYCKGEIVYFLPCSNQHHFHKQCLSLWAQIENVCPYCRHQFDYIE